MEYLVQTTVPRCPKCTGKIVSTLGKHDIFYDCNTCKSHYKVIREGQNTNEVVIEEVNYAVS